MGFSDGRVLGFGAPVLAVCGFSGSGKTTLLEAVIPRLRERGLSIAIVKHDAHGFQVDKPGKDSDRLFRAGATVSLRGPDEQFERRGKRSSLSLETILARLGSEHDLLLVEGHKDTALPKVWVGNSEALEPPGDVREVLAKLPWNTDRVSALMDFIEGWLPTTWSARPLYAGLLLGGRSSRMGSPKQLLRFGGRSLGERVAAALGIVGEEKTVALGTGPLPESLSEMPRLADPPGFAGPGAGLIAAHRWAPEAAWIVAACDHPWLGSAHISWLASQRLPGRWAVIPNQPDGHPCATLALYEPQALEVLERATCADIERNPRPLVLLKHPQTFQPELPPEVANGWKNVNTPAELQTEEERWMAANECPKPSGEWREK